MSDLFGNHIVGFSTRWLKECLYFFLIFVDRQGRRYQNYVYGMKLDCTQWKKDYENCVKFNHKRDIQAAVYI